MPGDSPGEAVSNFLAPIKAAISVLGNAHVTCRAHPDVGKRESAVVNRGDGLRVESSVYGTLKVLIQFGFVVLLCAPDDPRGTYRCSIRLYAHSLYDANGERVIAFHYHPESVSEDRGPHMHIGNTKVLQAAELHVPTPRITVEEFVTMTIDSFGAVPTVDEDVWRPLLEGSRQVHERWRNWHHRTDAPSDFR